MENKTSEKFELSSKLQLFNSNNKTGYGYVSACSLTYLCMNTVDSPGLEPGIVTGTGKWIICNVQNTQSENTQSHMYIQSWFFYVLKRLSI